MRQHPLSAARLVFVLAAVTVSVGVIAAPIQVKLPVEAAKFRPSSQPGYELALQKCGICHSADYIAYQPPALTLTQWTAEVSKMQHTYGAPIAEDEVIRIGAYLAVAYGSAKADDGAVIKVALAASAPVASATQAQALLTRNGCLGCHSVAQKVVGPAYKDVAAKYRQDPTAQSKLEASIRGGGSGKWGTVAMPPFPSLSPADLKTLAEFVRQQ